MSDAPIAVTGLVCPVARLGDRPGSAGPRVRRQDGRGAAQGPVPAAPRHSILGQLGDAAVLSLGGVELAMSTDTFVVSPLEFPGGNIGSLAVHGTLNDWP